MSKFGTLTDYATGEPVREATADEWLMTARQLNSQDSDSYTGAWRNSDDLRTYFVDGGPDTEVTFDQVFELGWAANEHGDSEMAVIAAKACAKAVKKEYGSAWKDCVEAILNARIEAA